MEIEIEKIIGTEKEIEIERYREIDGQRSR